MSAKNTALLMIDIQNDFCPGGALAVNDGATIVPVVNAMQDDYAIRILTQDWHPQGHTSFADNHSNEDPYTLIKMPYGDQVLWPTHCVQGTKGARFHEDLRTDNTDMIIRKGYNPNIDSYSAFFENDQSTPTGLSGYLNERGVTDVVLCGLATDFCVYYSAMDALKCGFGAKLITKACRAIDLDGSLNAAMDTMKNAGVKIV